MMSWGSYSEFSHPRWLHVVVNSVGMFIYTLSLGSAVEQDDISQV